MHQLQFAVSTYVYVFSVPFTINLERNKQYIQHETYQNSGSIPVPRVSGAWKYASDNEG